MLNASDCRFDHSWDLAVLPKGEAGRVFLLGVRQAHPVVAHEDLDVQHVLRIVFDLRRDADGRAEARSVRFGRAQLLNDLVDAFLPLHAEHAHAAVGGDPLAVDGDARDDVELAFVEDHVAAVDERAALPLVERGRVDPRVVADVVEEEELGDQRLEFGDGHDRLRRRIDAQLAQDRRVERRARQLVDQEGVERAEEPLDHRLVAGRLHRRELVRDAEVEQHLAEGRRDVVRTVVGDDLGRLAVKRGEAGIPGAPVGPDVELRRVRHAQALSGGLDGGRLEPDG